MPARRPVSSGTRGVVMSGLAALLLALALAGCTGPVEIDSPDVDVETRSACARFLDALPEKVSDERAAQSPSRTTRSAPPGETPRSW